MAPRQIQIRGASTHNLRSVDADIPHGAITVITGVSGSGKSSLAIDTLYAEGQRRFVESLSAYARQFLERLARADVERVDFIPPAIAIGQASRPRAARATVGSMCQATDLLQLLFGAAAEPSCPKGHGLITRAAPSAARAALANAHSGKRATIVAPILTNDRGRTHARLAKDLVRDGYTRLLGPGGAVTSFSADAPPGDAEYRVIVDRLVIADGPRLAEAVASALALGAGRAEVHIEESDQPITLRDTLACATCGFEPSPREARLFASNSPIGACPDCQGFGRIARIDPARVVPDPTRTLLGDAIAPWSTPGHSEWKDDYHRSARQHGLRLDVAWQDLSEDERALVWRRVEAFFAHLERKRYKMSARILVARYRGYVPCTTCGGRRLVPGALAWKIGGRSIADTDGIPIASLAEWLRALSLDPATEPLRAQALRRLDILRDVGLGYLTLGREGRTLSSGEARRVHLSSALGAGVTGTLYVLDEPSIGLHPRDTARLIRVLSALTEAGNTAVVVEHDTDVIMAADKVIELGPAAGRNGGRVIFSGTPAELRRSATPTGRALRGPSDGVDITRFAGIDPKAASRGPAISVRGARARTLREIDVHVPLGALTCITGVSGSGKSTLLHEVVADGLNRAIAGARPDPSRAVSFGGLDAIRAVQLVDTSPLARSTRSIPATFLAAWTPIRAALAMSRDARSHGLTARDFSFNSGGGRCEACQGLGTVTVDMHFLADVTMTCEICRGRRFSERVLAAKWRGFDVHQVLDLTVDEAHVLFADHPRITSRLKPLRDVGLGYLVLGQATATLSGGEAQRLKLAAHLAERASARTVLLLDEPTTGLHLADVEHLLRAFAALIDRGATLVVVEHHLEVIRHAHHVIDLGPDGGDAGGHLVAEGTIFDLMETPASHTGRALAAYLGTHPEPHAAAARG